LNVPGSIVASDNTTDEEINNRIGSLEDSVSACGHNMALQTPERARCTRQLCFQHCTQLRHTLSTIATLQNFPKCISGIYDKSSGFHGKTTSHICWSL